MAKNKKIKVWLDDYREAPDGWIRAVCAVHAITLLETGLVEEISLDHDLGMYCKTGYDVISWIEREVMTNKFKPPIIHIHTENPVGRKQMEIVAQRIREFNGKV